MTRASRRAGFTMLESLAVIMGVGVVLSLSIVIMRRSGKIHLSAVQEVTRLRTLSSLENRIRADARRAMAADTSNSRVLEFRMEDLGQVRYRVQPPALVRERLEAGQVVGVDQWRLTERPTLSAKIAASESSGNRRELLEVSLTLPTASETEPTDTNTLRIVTGIGDTSKP